MIPFPVTERLAPGIWPGLGQGTWQVGAGRQMVGQIVSKAQGADSSGGSRGDIVLRRLTANRRT